MAYEAPIPEDGDYTDADIVGITGIRYDDPNDVRFALSLETAEKWRDENQPYVVVDGSPRLDEYDDWVAKAHEARGATVLQAAIGGIATQRMQGVAYAVANGAERTFSHEPEKTPAPILSEAVGQALQRSDVLVVGRTERAENSLPPVQQRTERLAGWVLENTLALPADALSGPRGFTVAGADQLAEYPALQPGMNNWIYLYDTPLAARAAGLGIDGLKVDMMHPLAMVDEETDNPVFDAKRYEQFRLQLDYLLRRNDAAPTPQARFIGNTVLTAIDGMQGAANEEWERRFGSMERIMADHGYVPAARLT